MISTATARTRWVIVLMSLVSGLMVTSVLAWMAVGAAAAVAAPSELNDNESAEILPDEGLDDLSLLLNWAGGGASGVIGELCDVDAIVASGTPCEIAQNEIMRVNVSAALSSRGLPDEPKPSLVLRFADNRERQPDDEAGDTLFWWIPLDALGNATLAMSQGSNQAQFPVKVTERGDPPIIAAAWQREGPDAPTELLPAGRAGSRLATRLAGFPADQDVDVLLFRLLETHALGNLAIFDRRLANVKTNQLGTATYVWDTDRDEEPGGYAIHTIPESEANGVFSNQGAQFCIAPRNGDEVCASTASATGPESIIEPLVARSVELAARTWARLAHDPTRPISELNCVYADSALAGRRQQLQSLRTSGDSVDAHLARKVRVQSLVEAKPEVLRSGIEAIVVERWDGSVHHADGSETDIEPGRQTWRYVLKRSDAETFAVTPSPCGSGLVIAEATLQQ
ncbi:MAG TPA: hypothetical protein VHX16_00600 [Chloroflexota bacterium]|nr:hypothetical protein [Chloroflexota bacterium]